MDDRHPQWANIKPLGCLGLWAILGASGGLLWPGQSAWGQTLAPALPAAPLQAQALPLPLLSDPLPPLDLPPAAPLPAANYLLGVGDGLTIKVIGYGEFDSQQVILPDGTITLPLLGPIAATGKSLEELTQELTQALGVFLVNPVVTLNLTTQRPIRVTVGGEVLRPGPLQLSGTGGNSIAQVLVLAGGVGPQGDVRRITVRRTLPQGQEQLLVVNLWEGVQGENREPVPLVRDGDGIFVPRLPEDEGFDRTLLARSSLAPQSISVYFLGEVARTGEAKVPPQSSLSEALALVGGATPSGRLGRVTLIRRQEDGTIAERTLDLKGYRNSEQVQAGDIIIIAKKPLPRLLDGIQSISESITAPFQLFQLIQEVFNTLGGVGDGSSDSNN